MAIGPKSIILAGTAGITPSSNDVAIDATFTLVSDSEKSSLCLATGGDVFISSVATLLPWLGQSKCSLAPRCPLDTTDDDDSDAEPTSDTAAVVKRLVTLQL
jgi:hypothetical protein